MNFQSVHKETTTTKEEGTVHQPTDDARVPDKEHLVGQTYHSQDITNMPSTIELAARIPTETQHLGDKGYYAKDDTNLIEYNNGETLEDSYGGQIIRNNPLEEDYKVHKTEEHMNIEDDIDWKTYDDHHFPLEAQKYGND